MSNSFSWETPAESISWHPIGTITDVCPSCNSRLVFKELTDGRPRVCSKCGIRLPTSSDDVRQCDARLAANLTSTDNANGAVLRSLRRFQGMLRNQLAKRSIGPLQIFDPFPEPKVRSSTKFHALLMKLPILPHIFGKKIIQMKIGDAKYRRIEWNGLSPGKYADHRETELGAADDCPYLDEAFRRAKDGTISPIVYPSCYFWMPCFYHGEREIQFSPGTHLFLHVKRPLDKVCYDSVFIHAFRYGTNKFAYLITTRQDYWYHDSQ